MFLSDRKSAHHPEVPDKYRKARAASRIYYIVNGMTELGYTLIFTVMTIYFVQIVHMDALQLVLVGTAVEGSVLVFEVPTGVLADTFSRRLSVIIGTIIIGIAFLLMGMVPIYWVVFVSQVVWGLGHTFTSGATQAWLADEVGEDAVGGIYIRSGQINRGVGLAGAVLCALLAMISLQTPILVGAGLIFFTGVMLILYMPETSFKPRAEAINLWNGLGEMGISLSSGIQVVRSRSVLVGLLVVQLFIGAASEGYDRLGSAYLLENFAFPVLPGNTEVSWFSILSIAGTLLTLGVVALIRKPLEDASRSPQVSACYLLVFQALATMVILVFAFSGNFWLAISAMMTRSLLSGISAPLHDSWLVYATEPSTRATVISMLGQSDALGQVTGVPGVGAIGKHFSMRAALVTSAIVTLPILFFYERVWRKGKLEE